FHAFIDAAIDLGYCTDAHIDGESPEFNFDYNNGPIYCPATTEAVVALIKFAKYHAVGLHADKYTITSAHGLRGMTTLRSSLSYNFVVWEIGMHHSDDPRFISLPNWLEMNGRSFDEV
ncbi:hypothetical protein KBD68_04495, partial [Candidatus Woesebacteria bacterium]|nr:hypothetical protein [Candidatus Woesebacteria bacterium]